MTALEHNAWGFASVFGLLATGTGIAWGINAHREHACVQQHGGFDCLDAAIGATIFKYVFIATGVLTAAAVTTAGVAHYRRKR